MTRRGNARQFLLACDPERLMYLDLLRQYVKLHPLLLLGYCLMSNQVHLSAIATHARRAGWAASGRPKNLFAGTLASA